MESQVPCPRKSKCYLGLRQQKKSTTAPITDFRLKINKAQTTKSSLWLHRGHFLCLSVKLCFLKKNNLSKSKIRKNTFVLKKNHKIIIIDYQLRLLTVLSKSSKMIQKEVKIYKVWALTGFWWTAHLKKNWCGKRPKQRNRIF